jgi:hypothetical protein
VRLHFHAAGLIVLASIGVLALIAGPVAAIAVVRMALVLYLVATAVEIVVNMVRHRDTHVRSRLLSLLFDSTFSPWRASFAPRVRSDKR